MSPTNALGHRFIELLTVDSTNNYAMGLVHEGMAQHGTVVFTHEQTKGKGQRQKQWLSTAYQNVLMSVILKPFGLTISQQFIISMSTALAVQHFFSKRAGTETKVKWPNDLYWRDRKAGGILIENVVKGNEWMYAVVGIGININQNKFEHFGREAVSLKQITGRNYDAIQLARELLKDLQQFYNEVTPGTNKVLAQYQEILYKRNETARLKKGNRVFNATIKGVNEQGQLITEHGIEEVFEFGEIEWLS